MSSLVLSRGSFQLPVGGNSSGCKHNFRDGKKQIILRMTYVRLYLAPPPLCHFWLQRKPG